MGKKQKLIRYTSKIFRDRVIDIRFSKATHSSIDGSDFLAGYTKIDGQRYVVKMMYHPRLSFQPGERWRGVVRSAYLYDDESIAYLEMQPIEFLAEGFGSEKKPIVQALQGYIGVNCYVHVRRDLESFIAGNGPEIMVANDLIGTLTGVFFHGTGGCEEHEREPVLKFTMSNVYYRQWSMIDSVPDEACWQFREQLAPVEISHPCLTKYEGGARCTSALQSKVWVSVEFSMVQKPFVDKDPRFFN